MKYPPMRKLNRQLPREKALKIVEDGEYGVLALAADLKHEEGISPYAVPLNYSLYEGHVYFHCAREGRKLDFLKENDRVSFCVVGRSRPVPEQFTSMFESSIVFGSAEEVSGDEKREALKTLIRKYSPEHLEAGIEYIERASAATSVFCIRIEHITGKGNWD